MEKKQSREWKKKNRSERFCRIGGELLSNWDKAKSKDAGLKHNICGVHAYKLACMWISEHGYPKEGEVKGGDERVKQD